MNFAQDVYGNASDAMNFAQGASNTSPDEQFAAFVMYTISTYATLLERCAFILPHIMNNTDISMMRGTSTDQAFLGAVRAGFERMIVTLPEKIQKVVNIHLHHTLDRLYEKVNRNIVDCDIIFGYQDPFNYFYKDIRQHAHHPIVASETK